MRRPRLLVLVVAVVVLGGAVSVLLPGTADAPNPDDSRARVAVPAPAEKDVPAPPSENVSGVVTDINVNDTGILTVAGKTQRNGSAENVAVAFWIDREPAESVSTETSAPPVPEPGRFSKAVQLREGPQEVCAIALNDAGPDAVLGCEKVMYRAQLVEGKMIIADYGSGATPRLGIAGEGTPLEAAQRVAARAKEWEEATGIPTIPAFDYIQTVAQASPGSDGDYSAHTSREDLDTYLAAIRSVDGLLILDFQPGGGHFMKQVVQYEDYLRQPDVGLALDTEWRMPWGVAPATIIGYATASEINEVGEYLANIVAEDNLPQKAFVIHQFRAKMVRDRAAIVDRPELATIFHIDGHGTKQLKRTVYRQLLPGEEFYAGFKLFFDEDTGLMTPLEVRDDLARIPAMVSYQ
ncbi:MAG: hypothetical protein HKN03_14605 [Acidimicrobiales bacterium]|nr:hypothetical protein [Acidimicrobiales bacterium]